MTRPKRTLLGIAAVIVATASFLLSAQPDNKHPNEVRPSTVKPFSLPKTLSIAGEAMPLDRLDVREKLDRELLVNTYWQSNNLLLLKRSGKFFPIIEPILAKYGVPDDFKYLALIESGLQTVVSPAGAAGYWQIMKTTGRENGLEINSEVDERNHIVKSTEVACQYLLDAKERLGSWTLAAAAYNMGQAGAERRLAEQQVNSYYDLHLNSETARYVFRLAAIKYIHEHLDDFGYVFSEDNGYRFPAMDTVVVDASVSSWVDWAKAHNSTYQTLRFYNPWIVDNTLTITSDKTYQIWLPSKR